MGLMERFFGRGEPDEGGLVPNEALENPLSLQLLFADQLTAANLDPRRLTRTLRGTHPDLAKAVFEIDDATAAQGTPLGLAGWGKHVVKFVGFSSPMPAE